MLRKKIGSMKKLARKSKLISNTTTFGHGQQSQHHEHLLKGCCEGGRRAAACRKTVAPTGTFSVYVGEERQRFIVPTSYLSHPLFKILLEKSHDEFGFGQTNRLIVPCSVATFQDVVSTVQCSNGQFYFGELVEEFL